MMTDTTMLALRILARIQCHDFRNPISREALAGEFGIDARKVSSIVSDLHDAGHKIAWSRGGYDKYLNCQLNSGYFLAKTPEQMRSTVDTYEKMAMRYLNLKKSLMDFGNEPTIWEQGAA